MTNAAETAALSDNILTEAEGVVLGEISSGCSTSAIENQSPDVARLHISSG